MSDHRYPSHQPTAREKGFTLVELLVVIVVLGVLSTAAVTFFSTAFVQYLSLQEDSSSIGDLAVQSQRVASVVRGSTDIIAASDNDLSVYAYFYPNDQFESQVRYYKSADGKKLLADVTPMTSNHPIGTPIIAKKQTFTVINNFYTLAGVNLFNYLDAANNTLSTPITDQRAIKGIKINLAEPFTNSIAIGENPMSLVVSLRNRKTNL